MINYNTPVLQGLPNYFTREWYITIANLVKAVTPSGPTSNGIVDIETLAYLQDSVSDFGQIPQLIRSVDEATKLAALAVPSPEVRQAKQSGDDGQLVAWLLSELLSLSAQGSTQLGGTMAHRPTSPVLYSSYFDTTLGQPIWASQVSPAVVWKNAAGVTV